MKGGYIFLVPQIYPIRTSIAGENLRGEDRWRRNALRAFLQEGYTVATWTEQWLSEQVPPENFIDNLSAKPELYNNNKVVVISHSLPTHIYGLTLNSEFPKTFHKYLINIWSSAQTTPDGCVPAMKELVNSVANREDVAITHSFSRSLESSQIRDALRQFGIEDRFSILCNPGVESVDFGADNFDKKTLLWLNRDPYGWFLRSNGGAEVPARQYMSWLASKLLEDEEYNITFITGDSKASAESNWGTTNLKESMLSHTIGSPLRPFQDRVHILLDTPWEEVMSVIKNETKLLINTPMRYGGPPIEAASVGIPTVGLINTNPFIDMPGYHGVPEHFYVGLPKEYDRLLHDHTYYRQEGDRFRQYTHDNYTYKAFVDNTLRLLGIG